MSQYHQESFGGKKPKQKQASPAPVAKPSIEDIPDTETIDRKSNSQKANTINQPAVFFSELGKEIPCDEEESILEVAEQHGVAIRSACRQGVCGACKVHKLEGEVRYEGDPDALSDHDEGCILPCIAFPVGKVTIQV